MEQAIQEVTKAYRLHMDLLVRHARAVVDKDRDTQNQLYLWIKDAEAALYQAAGDLAHQAAPSACPLDVCCTKQIGHLGSCGSFVGVVHE